MSIGTKPRSMSKKPAKAASKTKAKATPEREASQALLHVVGKPAEIEPREHAALPSEEPEAAMRSAEAPDAGYGRCTESSDWENRGRS